ncbi:MAG: sulfotransferase, partial [Acetobacteraceae bacterium]
MSDKARRSFGPLTEAGRMLDVVSPASRAIRDALAEEAPHFPSAPPDRRQIDEHVRLGALLHGLGQREAAIEHLRQAADAAPETTQGRICLIQALMIEENNADAEALARRAHALEPRNAEVNRLLASLLSLKGAFGEAVAHFERAIDADPRNGAAWLGLVRARKITQADRPLIGRMASLVARSMPEQHRMLLHFALGKALDDVEDSAAAWEHFAAANRLRRRSVPADRDGVETLITRMISTFTPAFLGACRALGDSDETPVLVLGMPRSGTTLVEQIVSSHPDVAGGGELRVWTAAGAAWTQAGG